MPDEGHQINTSPPRPPPLLRRRSARCCQNQEGDRNPPPPTLPLPKVVIRSSKLFLFVSAVSPSPLQTAPDAFFSGFLQKKVRAGMSGLLRK